ncbi:MAG: hypothetical protein ACYTDT_03745 [Planctomycetota bacterium]|jgi:hypothetical protein
MAKAFELNQLSTGEYISRGFAVFSRNMTRMMTWVGFSWLMPMLVLMSFGFLTFDPYAMSVHDARYDPSIWATTNYAMYHWLLYISGVLLFFGITYGGLVFMTSRFYLGDDPPLQEVIKAVFKRLANIFLAGQLTLLLFVALAAIAYSFAVLLYLADNEPAGILVGMFISSPLLIVLVIFIGARYGLASVSVICDEESASDSFGRSSVLTKDHRGRVVVLLLMSVLVVGGPFNTGLFSLGGLLVKNMLENVEKHLLGDALRLCWFAVCIPIMVAPFVVMYFDMICRKESYDLAVMARSFGISQEQMDAFRFDSTRGYMPEGYRRNTVGARKMMPPPAPVAPPPQGWGPQQQMHTVGRTARMPAQRARRPL